MIPNFILENFTATEWVGMELEYDDNTGRLIRYKVDGTDEWIEAKLRVDCSYAIVFLKEMDRLCKLINARCSCCPFSEPDKLCKHLTDITLEDIATLQIWSDNYPPEEENND